MLKRSAALGLSLFVLAALAVGCQMMPEFENNYQKGTWLQERGRHEQAIQAFYDFREERPDSVLIPMMLLRQGESYEALGHFDEAMRAYQEAADLSPTDVAPFARDNMEALQQRIEAQKAAEEEARRAAEEEARLAAEAEEEARRAAEAEEAARELERREAEKQE